MTFARTAVSGLALAGIALSMAGTDASAATARHIYNKGHYGTAHPGRYYRHYGNARVGRVVAGAALGLIGAAAGAAIADNYDGGGYYGGGYYGGGGYPYGGPGYAYGGYPPAPYTYGGYGYGYEPY